MCKPLAITGVFVVATLAMTPAASAAIIEDSTFPSGDWQVVMHPFGPNGGSGSATQSALGREGTGWFVVNSVGPSFSGVWNASIFTGFTYTPAISGALTDLSLSIDSRQWSGLQAISFVVTQSGHAWRIGYFLNTSVWDTYALANPVAADFAPLTDGAPAVPDFSASGGSMRFGIAVGNSSVGGGYSTEGLYDNFRVDFVPAPGPAALMLAGFGIALRRRR